MARINNVTKLSNIYYDISNAAGFSSQNKLAKASGVPIDEVKKWLSSQDAYTQHKPIKRKFTRNRYVVSNMRVCYEADLADMQSLASENSNFKYILCVIDIFSKKAWGEPLKNKKSATVATALQKIFARAEYPLKLRHDRGREFLGPEVRKLLKDNNVTQIVTDNEETKCAVIERFLRSLKERMHRYFTHFGVQQYDHILQDLFLAYNDTEHTAIGRKPNEVNSRNIKEVYDFLYSGNGRYEKLGNVNIKSSKFKINDTVKISASKHKLHKGYHPNWSYEMFKIAKIINRSPVVYKLVDWEGEEVTGVWYAEELQQVKAEKDQAYRIEKILESKGKGSKKQFLIKWLGYPKKFNSYIFAKDLISYE